jgi:hypothetical protein
VFEVLEYCIGGAAIPMPVQSLLGGPHVDELAAEETAGFACQRVRPARRVPFPPARTNANVRDSRCTAGAAPPLMRFIVTSSSRVTVA